MNIQPLTVLPIEIPLFPILQIVIPIIFLCSATLASVLSLAYIVYYPLIPTRKYWWISTILFTLWWSFIMFGVKFV